MYASNDSNYKTIVFILGVDLPVGIENHEIVASKDNKVLYTIGNAYSYDDKDKDIYKGDTDLSPKCIVYNLDGAAVYFPKRANAVKMS